MQALYCTASRPSFGSLNLSVPIVESFEYQPWQYCNPIEREKKKAPKITQITSHNQALDCVLEQKRYTCQCCTNVLNYEIFLLILGVVTWGLGVCCSWFVFQVKPAVGVSLERTSRESEGEK